jgi:SAM-dependent methyltransferase
MKEINPNDIDVNIVNDAEIVLGSKSPTLNGMGYVFFTISALGQEFLKNETSSNKEVLEIGAGYNNIIIEALRNGVGSYTANDIVEEHLNILVKRIKQVFGKVADAKLKHLKLLIAKAPQDLPDVKDKYDAILIDKVMHFMNPDEIIKFISWSKKALKNGGKIYVSTGSPYLKTYRKAFPGYLERLAQGDLFPGYFKGFVPEVDPSKVQYFAKYKMPEDVVFFARQDLIDLFEREGMKVEKSYSFRTPVEDEKTWQEVPDEESETVGVIAVKM